MDRKSENRRRIYESLDIQTKKILDQVSTSKTLAESDPFGIKDAVMSLISSGDEQKLHNILIEIQHYLDGIANELINSIMDIFSGTTMLSDYSEYRNLQDQTPEIDNEESLLIQ